jgi:hypothetical protein
LLTDDATTLAPVLTVPLLTDDATTLATVITVYRGLLMVLQH